MPQYDICVTTAAISGSGSFLTPSVVSLPSFSFFLTVPPFAGAREGAARSRITRAARQRVPRPERHVGGVMPERWPEEKEPPSSPLF